MFERQLRIFSFLNDTGETIPAFACMALKPDAQGDHAATDRNSDMVLSIRKPTAEDALAQDAARIVFNLETPVPNGAYGRCVMSYPALARVDDADLDIGNGVGPVAGSWAMNGNGTAFTAITADPTNSYYENDTKRAWLVRPGSGKPLGFVNFACEEIPAFACMEVTGTLAYGAETYLTVRKPEGSGPFVFNGAYAVASCGYGTIQRLPMVRAKGSIDAKERAVPVAGSWEVSQDDSGVWQSAGPDRHESGVSILNASGLPSLTTTTSGLPNNPGLSACQGSCYWTSSGGVTWTKSTDTCATATTTSTTAPATTTTTTPCPCTSTTTTTSTTVACQCPRPSFCPSLPGDCTYTYCDRQTYDSVDRCTTTTCDCNTTTTTGAPGTCGWYVDCQPEPGGPSGFPFSVKTFDDCAEGAICPLSSGMLGPGFGSYNLWDDVESQYPCITGTTYDCVRTTTTACPQQSSACEWIAIEWGACGFRWQRPENVLDPNKVIDVEDPTSCGTDDCPARCPYPNFAPTSCGQVAYTSCSPSSPASPCAKCTTTTANCNANCRWRWNAAITDWVPAVASPCPAFCPCAKPTQTGSGDCEIMQTPCGSGTSTTTSTTSTTTTTTPAWGACCFDVGSPSQKACIDVTSVSQCSGSFYSGRACNEINCNTTTTSTTSTTTSTTTTTTPPLGACCRVTRNGLSMPCYVATQEDCLADRYLYASVSWAGAGTDCGTDPCPVWGCCCKNGIKSTTTQDYCNSISGVFTESQCLGLECTTTTTTAPATTSPI